MEPYTPGTRKLYTLIVPLDSERVLLGYKKRGFGQGKYNGFGGKVEPGETIAEGAIRELEEEACIKVKQKNLPYHGILFLETTADPTVPILEIHVFTATAWTGEPMETEEMRPEWFAPPSGAPGFSNPPIPFHTMWEETREWLPLLLGFYFPGSEGAEKVQIVHHVTFKGGLNPETGLEDIWHGMDHNFAKWLGNGKEDEEGFPGRLEDWTEEIRGQWLEKRRKARFNISQKGQE